MQLPSDASPRYARQARLHVVGDAGQRTIERGVAVIVGCGALGTVAADLLVRAGVGRVVIADRDVVELSNLHRQTLFDEDDARAGKPKAIAAADRLRRVNGRVEVVPRVMDATAETIGSLLDDADDGQRPRVLVDATDNFGTRLLINDAAVRWGWPLVYAGVVGTDATLMTVLPAWGGDESEPSDGRRPWLAAGLVGPCLRCLMDEAPAAGAVPTCESAGVLGSVSAAVAAMQATEAIKCLLGDWSAVERRLVRLDAWGNRLDRLDTTAARDPDCPCCGRGEFDHLARSSRGTTVTLCGRGAVQVTPAGGLAVSLETLADQLSTQADARLGPGVLRAQLPDAEPADALTVFDDGRTLVHGTQDPAVARTLVARYLGG
ncbi:MAG: ThiF family adenylyltransferase [Planctomycetota bacterium]